MSTDRVTNHVSLSELAEPKKNEKSYKVTLWWLVIATFIIVYLVLSQLFYTFTFSLFFTDNDFLSNWNTAASSGSGANKLSNKIYSDKGRLTIFLWSFGLALLASIISYFVLSRRKEH